VESDEYAYWYYIGWAQSSYCTLDILSSMMLAFALVKYMRVINPQFIYLFNAFRGAIGSTLPFFMCAIIGFLGFILYFHLLAGSYSIYFSDMSYSLMSLMQFNVGRWISNVDLIEFVSLWYLIIGMSVFSICRMIVIILQVVKFQHCLSKVLRDKPAVVLDKPR
jgi:hypothetical protein